MLKQPLQHDIIRPTALLHLRVAVVALCYPPVLTRSNKREPRESLNSRVNNVLDLKSAIVGRSVTYDKAAQTKYHIIIILRTF